MAVRIFLAAMAIVWLRVLRSMAGVIATTPTARTELRAMYGGLQSAIGVLALAATVRPHLERPALVILAVLLPGLAFEVTGSLGAVALLRRT